MTHTYLVENYFAAGQQSLRSQIFTRYGQFVKKLLVSPSKEIRFLSAILLKDPSSTLWKNVYHINNLTDVNILVAGKVEIRNAIRIDPIPASDQWRVGLLNIFLEARILKNYSKLNLNKVQFIDMLDSLCKS